MTLVAGTLQGFFTERLGRQKQASPRTIATYRDAFRLLLRWMNDHHGITPSDLRIEDLDSEMILAFLDHLEAERNNSARSRNARLAAIRSFFRYAALRHPEHAALIQRVLAIPQKRFDKTTICYLTQPEIDALLAAPDTTTGKGGETSPFSPWPSKPASAYPNCSAWTVATSTWAPVATWSARAKAGKSGPPRSPNPPGPSWAAGYANETASQPTQCSRPARAVASNAAPSSDGSSNTGTSPPTTAPP
jgi:hypothetical protein